MKVNFSDFKIIPVLDSIRRVDMSDEEYFSEKYSNKVYRKYLFSQKDVGQRESLLFKPIYMLPFIMEEL